MRNAVMLREAFVQERVVAVDQVEDTAILLQNALKKELRLLPKRLSQVVVEIREQAHVGIGRIQIAKIQPLPGKVADQRSRTIIRQHSPNLVLKCIWSA